MPRTQTLTALDRRIQDIVGRAAGEIAQAVRQSIAEEVARLVAGAGRGGRGALEAASFGARKRRVILCPVPGCGKPGGGPKWGWFCAEHKTLPESEKAKARAARARAAADEPVEERPVGRRGKRR